MGKHSCFCYVSCLLWQLNSQLSSTRDLRQTLCSQEGSYSTSHQEMKTQVFANYSDFQVLGQLLRNYLTLSWVERTESTRLSSPQQERGVKTRSQCDYVRKETPKCESGQGMSYSLGLAAGGWTVYCPSPPLQLCPAARDGKSGLWILCQHWFMMSDPLSYVSVRGHEWTGR